MPKPKNKISFEYYPHLREVLNNFDNDKNVEITVIKATSCGFSTTIIQEPYYAKTEK